MIWPKSEQIGAFVLLVCAVSAFGAEKVGISVAERAADNSVEAEMALFDLADGYAANLFASEADGIANPIAIRWDPAGRLWVLTTLAYAQIEPGGQPNDRLLILEDTDGDGRADQIRVWAEGLAMPTGFALGHGGVYLVEGESLFFLSDTDGDGKADSRKILLNGFGTGDTHQNINSLSWGPAGDLWFCQGLHNFSRVETPWGIVRGEEAGFWRLRVRDLKLEPFCMGSMASQNPWGVGWNRWGSMFVKSNNNQLGYISPGIVPTEHFEDLMQIATVAATAGKSMGCEIVESSHLPELRDHVLIAGYFANRVTAYPLEEEGAGFKQTEGWELLVSRHTSFRPVEVKVGPDGAIYVADWFNPIIGHYQASLRHPDRDRAHGRIWRITRKERSLVQPPDLENASARELLETHLQSPERWVRYQARRRLADLSREEFEKGMGVEPKGANHTLEVIWARESQQFHASGQSIRDLLEHAEPPLRAYAARMIGRWENDLENPVELLNLAIADENPRVRLEAIVSAAHAGTPEAMKAALRALDSPRDRFIDYSLTQCVHALADVWLPALQTGELSFDSPRHLAFAVSTYGGSKSTRVLQELLSSAPQETQRGLLLVLAQVGGPEQLRAAMEALPADPDLLATLRETMRVRQVRPSGNVAALLQPALASDSVQVRTGAMELAGLWKVKPLGQRVAALGGDSATPTELRHAALLAAAQIPESGAAPVLIRVASEDPDRQTRKVAIAALANLDLDRAAVLTVDLFQTCESADEAGALLAPFLSRDAGSQVLAAKLAANELAKPIVSRVSQALASLGRNDADLIAVVNAKLGIQAGAQEYSADFVQKLVAEVQESGNAANGKLLYESGRLSCVACHTIAGKGGVIGPDLTTVGAGIPTDLIVEALLWPGRQLKEGYFSVSVVTKDGRVFNGYREREEDGVLWLRDVVMGKTEPIQLNQVAKRDDIGTLMPTGLMAGLSREELRDLVKFLSQLR